MFTLLTCNKFKINTIYTKVMSLIKFTKTIEIF
jgi:hypothetical protein